MLFCNFCHLIHFATFANLPLQKTATYLKKVNDDYTEYMVSFSIENAIYFVHSNEEMKDIIPIVNNCIEENLK